MTDAHDWGATVPDDLPIEQIIELRDGLRSGEISIALQEGMQITPEIEGYLRQVTEQIIAAYDRAIIQRRC